MSTKKIKELSIPVDKQAGKYTVKMSFSVPVSTRDLNKVSVRLTDQNDNVLWGPYLITKSPTEVTTTFSHTNLTRIILSRYLSNAYGITSHKFQVYWEPSVIEKTVTLECDENIEIWLDGKKIYSPPAEGTLFDTGIPMSPYPSMPGVFKGKLMIKGSGTTKVTNMTTRPCAGTGGRVASWSIVGGNEIEKGIEHDITVNLASYPQYFHVNKIENVHGILKCTSFVDANGKVHNDWIPSLLVTGNSAMGYLGIEGLSKILRGLRV